MGVVKDRPPSGSIRRGLRMGKLGLGLAGSYLGYQLQNLVSGKSTRDERRKGLRTRVSRRVREELGDLKGPFMKFGQILSMQTPFLSEEVIEELTALQMAAPGMHPTLARAQFESSMGVRPEEAFREFEPRPFAAASLGQVHRAVTRSGARVAVKIQYPAIRTAIENDFRVLRSASLPGRLTGHLPVALLDEIRRGFLEETDYLNEGKNLDFFRERLAPLEYVTVPRVHWDLTTDRVLTMSFVDGLHIREFRARKPTLEVRSRLGARLIEMFATQVWSLHALHADPHPGNYLFREDGGIGLVDFGSVVRISPGTLQLTTLIIDGHHRESEERIREMARVILGPSARRRSARVPRVLRDFIRYYEMIYPLPGAKPIVDFGDDAIFKALARNLRGAMRSKLSSPEFAFSARAEMGLLSLLHQLGARVSTREIWERVKRTG